MGALECHNKSWRPGHLCFTPAFIHHHHKTEAEMAIQMVFRIIVLLLPTLSTFARTAKLAKYSCEDLCGNVSIPYPFGMGAANCYLDKEFAIDCNVTEPSGSHKPFLREHSLEVLEIMLDGSILVKIETLDLTKSTKARLWYSSRRTPFMFSQAKNRFVGVGCNNFATIRSPDNDSVIIGGCMSVCDESGEANAANCSGINCCQTPVPFGVRMDQIILAVEKINLNGPMLGARRSAFLVETEWFEKNFKIPAPDDYRVAMALEWQINSTWFNSLPLSENADTNATSQTYNCSRQSTFGNNSSLAFKCSCKPGYAGNPYLLEGCQDIDECAVPNPNPCSRLWSSESGTYEKMNCKNTNGSYECYSVMNTRLRIKGIIIGKDLKRLLVGMFRHCLTKPDQLQVKWVENTNLFAAKDLEKATDHFNVNRILGQGGQGTVYKGMLADGRIVAVKKSKVIDEGVQLKEFINEVVILSRINHRNVVKLLGYCLETEVPLLVYEFIPNGTLFQYLHNRSEEFPLSWDTRLRIATEVAGALFYLHSGASSPVYHRDIKSTNILLDEKYRAKVADFGTSRSVAVDQSRLMTGVQGTFGYLDPEYFWSSIFTDKSDVFSFGVVLAELLTGEKPIISSKTVQAEAKNLATYFTDSMEENNLFGIVDKQLLGEGQKEEIVLVGNLTKRCLKKTRKERPTMREVAIELEAARMSRKTPNFQQIHNVVEDVKIEMYESWDVSKSALVGMDCSVSSSLDAEPLLS
ncbi:Wall-associated receptor kinase-like 2 [Morella rubra]|uniref:Wall-associated receptor kinase-like 2 n=1 Tax=Morella rubra TaxID=262757 RepID=A0A6A1UUG7_9ROSI|nr:Wall-associated receptor kinase-like 2 [Morella rubra]